MLHDVTFHSLHAQCDGRQAVGDQVNPQQLHRKQWSLVPQQHGGKDGHNLTDVGAQQEADYLTDVGIDASTFADSIDNGGEVVVGQGHVGSAFGNVGAGDTHSTADISCF